MSPKKLGKKFICRLLERQVRELREKNAFTVIVVAGSVGKTSTKLAIAKTLARTQKVIYQEGNYNDRLTVPLVLFGQTEPNIFNPFAWRRVLRENAAKLTQAYPYNYAVLELGVDGPGQMKDFAYLQPELAVVTAVAPEHMEYFGDLKNIAKEELSVLDYSLEALLNTSDIAVEYLPEATYSSYGSENADYTIGISENNGLSGQHITFKLPDAQSLEVDTSFLGAQGTKVALAAVAAAHKLGLSAEQIKDGIESVPQFPGRMQVLDGLNSSKLIDDTYNASPLAMKAALDVLYEAKAPQRIAILGSMNEMGKDSPVMHQEIGGYCDPDKLDLVVTVGREAADYLAPAAAKKGCTVKTFLNAVEAGEFVKSQLKDGAVVLAKGSQNGVFAEEALKQLLKNPEDSKKLVRHSPYWLKIKSDQFK